MKSKLKEIITNNWTVTIVGGLAVTLIATVITDAIKRKRAFSTLKNVCNWGLNIILKFLNLQIRLWWLLLGVAILLIIIMVIGKISEKLDLKPFEPEFMSYHQDTISGYKWKWNWEKTYNGQYDINNLHPICSKCDTPLPGNVFSYSGSKCIRCGNINYERLPDIQNVKMLIKDNVRRKYFPNE